MCEYGVITLMELKKCIGVGVFTCKAKEQIYY